jgi:hypothetical protein
MAAVPQSSRFVARIKRFGNLPRVADLAIVIVHDDEAIKKKHNSFFIILRS